MGSWYGSYYDVGVNWASPSHKVPYEWARASYKTTGYANLLDWITTGCYAQYPTDEDAEAAGHPGGWTVVDGCRESNSVVENDTFVYGGLYLLYYKDPVALQKAIAAANNTSQGVMLFDLCYILDYNSWGAIEQAFKCPVKAPHTVPGLIDKAKKLQKQKAR